MKNFEEKNGSDKGRASSEFRRAVDLGNVTSGTFKGIQSFSFSGESNPVGNARTIIPQIENPVVAEQLDRLLVSIHMMIEIAKRKRPDLNDIPPLTAQVEEDGAVLLQWKFPDFRVGFNIEPDPNKSGWHLVSNEKLDEITVSGRLSNTNETVQTLLEFILPNI